MIDARTGREGIIHQGVERRALDGDLHTCGISLAEYFADGSYIRLDPKWLRRSSHGWVFIGTAGEVPVDGIRYQVNELRPPIDVQIDALEKRAAKLTETSHELRTALVALTQELAALCRPTTADRLGKLHADLAHLLARHGEQP